MKTITTLSAALSYADMGLSIIPVKKDKKPFIKWERYQKEKASEEQIRSWWSKHPEANIGIVTGAISGLVVIDIDTEEGKLAIQEYIPDSLIMPTANTPSGGNHLFFKCPTDKLGNNARLVPGCDLRGDGGYVVASPSINGSGKAYTWQKGLSIAEAKLPDLPGAYLSFVLKKASYIIKNSLSLYGCDKKTVTPVTPVTPVTKMFTSGTRDNDLFHVANCMKKGGMTDERSMQVLEKLAENCDPPFPLEEVRKKLQSAANREDSRTGTLIAKVEGWISVTSRDISVTDCYRDLNLVTARDKDNCRQAFRRLKDRTVIEPVGNRSGQYRKINKSFEPVMKFEEVGTGALDLSFPLGIEQYVKIFPSNIVIIAGEKSTGKTALCLGFATMNIKHEMQKRYISSEFGSAELYERLKPMDIDPDKWISEIQFNRFRGEPQDAILPDGINIIDYLEVQEGEFFKIGSQIDKIYDKLDKGIALIALQKNPFQDLARGGAMTLDKARLYVTLSRKKTELGLKNLAEIKDCKHFAMHDVNPNGFSCEYKLGGGHHFKRVTSWLP